MNKIEDVIITDEITKERALFNERIKLKNDTAEEWDDEVIKIRNKTPFYTKLLHR